MAQRPTTSRNALFIAAVASVLIGACGALGRSLLYPCTLLATWVHEMGHGLVTLALGGRFERLEIFGDASGLAHVVHGPGVVDALVCLGGLMAPPFVGALALGVARGPRRARGVVFVLTLALIVSAVLWVRSAAGLAAIPVLAILGLVVARWGSARELLIVAQFVGLRLVLDTLGRGLDYLFTDGVRVDGVDRASDIARVALGLGGPRMFWSLVVSAACLGLVAVGLYTAWRRAPDAAR
jgi:hypothetical protein